MDCGDSKLRDLIDSASFRSRDQSEGQYDSWDCGLRDRFRLVVCDISINGVFLCLRGRQRINT